MTSLFGHAWSAQAKKGTFFSELFFSKKKILSLKKSPAERCVPLLGTVEHSWETPVCFCIPAHWDSGAIQAPWGCTGTSLAAHCPSAAVVPKSGRLGLRCGSQSELPCHLWQSATHRLHPCFPTPSMVWRGLHPWGGFRVGCCSMGPQGVPLGLPPGGCPPGPSRDPFHQRSRPPCQDPPGRLHSGVEPWAQVPCGPLRLGRPLWGGLFLPPTSHALPSMGLGSRAFQLRCLRLRRG